MTDPQNDVDLSALDEDPAAAMADLGDDEAIKKIRQHTTPFGRIATTTLLVVAVAFGGFAYVSSKRAAEEEARLDAIGELDDIDQVLSELRKLYREIESPEIRFRIVRNLGHYKDTQAIDIFIDALDYDGPIRREAAKAIARLPRDVADKARSKLLQVLPRTDERDRAQVVWTLAVLGEAQAADAVLDQFKRGLLQNLEGFDPKVIVELLGPQRLASDELMGHEEESIRTLTAHALAEAANAEVIDPLTKMLTMELQRPKEKRSQEVIRAIAAGLGRIGDPRAARPLFDALRKVPELRGTIIDALRKSTGAPQLAVMVKEAGDVDLQRELVRLLAASHDDRVADELAELLAHEDAEIKELAAFGLAELGDGRARKPLVAYARGEDDSLADRALRALREVVDPSLSDDLKAMFESMPHRKADIMRLIGWSGARELAPLLEKELDGDDAPSAGIALAELGYEPAFDKLLKTVPLPKKVDMGAKDAAERSLTNEDLLRKRKGAIVAMGFYGRPEAFEPLTQVVENDETEDYELRALAAQAIGRLATAEQLQHVLGRIKDPGLDERSRRYYVQALWQKPHPELLGELVGMMADAQMPVGVRRAAALGVGYSNDGSVDQRLGELLDDAGSRRYAAVAVALGGAEPVVEKLLGVLTEDRETREILQDEIGADTDWFRLVTAEMFDKGTFHRRLAAARRLHLGTDKNTFGAAWAKAIEVVRSGWDGPGGLTPRQIRERLWKTFVAQDTDESLRDLVGHTLAAIPERGLLLRARDEGGPAAELARSLLGGTD